MKENNNILSDKSDDEVSIEEKQISMEFDSEDNITDNELSDSETEGNSGNLAWAKAMSTILNTTSKKGNFILSKAKTDSQIKQKKRKDIEIVDSSGKVIVDKLKKDKDKSFSELRKIQKENQKKKAEWEAMCHVKPDIIKKEKEAELRKIATRGVVHLFNTVEEHQKTAKNKNSAKHNEKLNVIKGTFMDMLKQHSTQDKKTEVRSVVEKEKQEETWSILKDDFMMSAEMKDWDKANSDDET